MDNVQNPIKNTALADVNATAKKADDEKAAKKEEYEAAKKKLSVWNDKKYAAYKRYQDAKNNAQNPDDSSLLDAKSAYTNISNSFTDAEFDVDISRGSYLDSIFYAGKMDTCAIMARDQLA